MSMDLEKKTFSTAPEYFLAGTTIGIAKATKGKRSSCSTRPGSAGQ